MGGDTVVTLVDLREQAKELKLRRISKLSTPARISCTSLSSQTRNLLTQTDILKKTCATYLMLNPKEIGFATVDLEKTFQPINSLAASRSGFDI